MRPAINAVFLDRDGTLIVDKDYLGDPAGVELLPGVGEGLLRLSQAGVRLFMVSNQSGIGRGYYTTADYQRCQARMDALLAEKGAALTDALCCPHSPNEDCACRKPGIAMWNELRSRYALQAEHCAMIGDKEADILFAHNAGMALSILVLTGKGAAEAMRLELPPLPQGKTLLRLTKKTAQQPDFIAETMESAVEALFLTEDGGVRVTPFA